MTPNTPPETTAAELLERAKSLCTEVMKRGKFAPHNAEVLWSAIDVYQQNTRLRELAALKAQQPTGKQSEMADADAWLDGGWRKDDPNTLSLGKIMLMTAKGSRKHGNVDPELAEIVGRNIQRKAQVGIDKVRVEQRAHRPGEID